MVTILTCFFMSKLLKGLCEVMLLSSFYCRFTGKAFLMLFFFIFERERQRQSTNGRGAERERATQNLKQALGSELLAQSLMQGLNPWTVASWPELKLDTQLTEPPRCPSVLKDFDDVWILPVGLMFSNTGWLHKNPRLALEGYSCATICYTNPNSIRYFLMCLWFCTFLFYLEYCCK